MNANVVVSEKSADTPAWIPDVPRAAVFGVLLVVALWLWAYFLRARAGLSLDGVTFAGVAVFCVLLSRWLTCILLESSIAREARKRDFRFFLLSFLLLAVCLPEGVLGQAASRLRAFLLLGFALLLFFSVNRLARHFRSGFNQRSVIRVLVAFCLVYFLLTSWFTLAKLRAFGY